MRRVACTPLFHDTTLEAAFSERVVAGSGAACVSSSTRCFFSRFDGSSFSSLSFLVLFLLLRDARELAPEDSLMELVAVDEFWDICWLPRFLPTEDVLESDSSGALEAAIACDLVFGICVIVLNDDDHGEKSLKCAATAGTAGWLCGTLAVSKLSNVSERDSKRYRQLCYSRYSRF